MTRADSGRLVSVIVPIHNAEASLARCVDSVLAQSHGRLDVVLIDDGSTDGSAAISERYAAADPRVRAIRINGEGVGAARNAGLEIARGNCIGFADADDWLDPDMIARLLSAMDDGRIAVCGYVRWEGGEARTPDPTGPIEAHSFETAAIRVLSDQSYDGFVWNKLFDAEMIRRGGIRFDPDIHFAEDVLFTIRCLIAAGSLRYDPAPLYRYDARGGDTLRRYNAKRLTELVAWDRARDLLAPFLPDALPAIRTRRMEASAYLLRLAVDAGDRQGARRLRAEIRNGIWEFLRSSSSPFLRKLRICAIALSPRLGARIWSGLARRRAGTLRRCTPREGEPFYP